MNLLLRISFSFTLLTFIHGHAFSQGGKNNFDKEWKAVQAYIEKQLPKSALAEVKSIYLVAKKNNQRDQVIKALVYTARLQDENRENNDALSIAELENEITGSQPIEAAILRSIVAKAYWQYFQQNRWKFYDRTATKNFDKKDIATWTSDDLFQRISSLFLASLKDERLLQQTSLSAYEAIINKGNMRHLRPTLYDLLAFEAIAFFESDEIDIKKPVYAFEIDQASAFAPAAEFINVKFNSRDSLSAKYKALQIYQRLIAFHLKDNKPDALIDADILRIHFVNENSIHPEKDKLYLAALQGISQKFGALPAASLASFYTAEYYAAKGNEYKPYGDSTHRLDLVKAKDICEKVLLQKDSSEGKWRCYNLLQSLKSRSLQFEVEKVNIPDQPIRSLVTYKNIDRLYLRIIKITKELKDNLTPAYDAKFWPTIIAANPFKTWQQQLPLPSDLQEHKTEIKVDALSPGEYLLVASDKESLENKDAIIGARSFYISGISFVNEKENYFVLDRESGSPLAKANVQVWEQRYDYKSSKYLKEKKAVYNTDANGFFHLKNEASDKNSNYYNYSFQLDISYKNDHLFMDDMLNDYYYRTTPPVENTNSVFLFTDRSIYRPGQLVYFKGIVLQKAADKKADINPAYTCTVLIRDANYKNIDSLLLHTNEFGSFNGKFKLPATGLTGEFTIYTKQDASSVGIKVEEYKRPKFFVDYETIKGTYKANDQIKVTGFAKAYAGNNIDGASVAYRVVRQPRLIYSWMFWRWWQPPVKQMEISHGEVKTDKDGKFNITFTAIPDLSIDRKFEPVFDYTIYADVTDINGETRSGSKLVSVSYKALQLRVNLPSTVEADSLHKFQISTTNLNGEYISSDLEVNITRLKPEDRVIRERFWDRPDQFIMTKMEYIQLFPHDEYDNEADPQSWPKGDKVYTKKDSSRLSGEWKLNERKWLPGFYEVEIIAKDVHGESVRDVQYMEITGSEVPATYLWTGKANTSVEPGDSATIQLGSAAKDIFLVQVLSKNDKRDEPSFSFTHLSNEKRTFQFPVTESDRGGYGVGWVFVKNNRLYQSNYTISVPWTNKELEIEYASFRDKTLPGSEEKWKIRIKGYKNDKVAAEMLATMYDASLDQFYAHSWSRPNVWPYYYNSTSWSGRENFKAISSETRYTPGELLNIVKTYDSPLNLELSSARRIYLRGMRSDNEEKKEMPAPKYYDELKEVKVVDIHHADLSFKTDSTRKVPDENKSEPSGEVKTRKNFNETAFFFPELRTDSSGTIEFSFTIPEALTRWKFMALAHTKDAAFGSSTKEIITQKELMVQPNPTRFLREGDKMEFTSKIVNLSSKEFTGIAELQLFDASTNESVDGWMQNVMPKQYFTVAAGQSDVVRFPIEVPYLFNKTLLWRVVAKTDNLSDGEENSLPVLTNRMLVTESLPLNLRTIGTKNFSFDKLLKSGDNTTLQHHALTVEFTSNPTWYAIQALPYLMEYPYECAEQTWNRYYANALATYISNSSPRIKQVFDKWRISDTAALLSNLQKNEELKAVLLEETPWVLQANNETQQKKNIALLFDMVKMADQLDAAFAKLKQMQSSNGGFVWFSGGPDDRYITQYIVTGIGHLKKLNALNEAELKQLNEILATALPYLDNKAKLDYDNLIKNKIDLKKYNLDQTLIQYLYMRGFFPGIAIAKEAQKAHDYFLSRLSQSWTGQNKFMQAMIALSLFRSNDITNSMAILRSLKETAIMSEELGMYYKDQPHGWWWHQAPIETQALIIEAFDEVGKDNKTADDLRTWLLKNKQTNNWQTTRATAEACYALLLKGTKWIDSETSVSIKLGNTTINSSDNKQEAGTGYFKTTIDGKDVSPAMGNISVTVRANQVNKDSYPGGWGSIYWQYFEDLDKITPAATPLSLKKKLFIEKNTDRGPVLTPVNDGDAIKIGDKVKVRIELRVDRDMEYVHLKDMRASSLEPVNVLSGYKWQGGLGYYESTRDASTNFFISYLSKGTYVFEYALFATHAGNFSNGVSTIQCMYAPEFSAHSEGIRINVEAE